MEDKAKTTNAEPTKVHVTRDPSFVRLGADRAIAYFLGRQVELVFIIENQSLKFVDMEQSDTFESEWAGMSEVARVRLGPAASTALALDILRELAPSGGIRVEKFEPVIKEILETARAAGQPIQARETDDPSS